MLKDKEVSATFFIAPKFLEQNIQEGLIQRMQDEGHSVGLAGGTTFVKENWEALSTHLSPGSPKLWGPSFGFISNSLRATLEAEGFTMIRRNIGAGSSTVGKLSRPQCGHPQIVKWICGTSQFLHA